MNPLIWMVPLALLITVLLIRAAAEKQHTRAIVKKRLKNLDMYHKPEKDALEILERHYGKPA